ncbi:MAG TPA: hypothetical protein VNO31_02840 [Umezawaea sp.]|nr:hypothetical protein [Umezawaea sp.]
MLATVFAAEDTGYSGSYSGAWDKLLQRRLVECGSGAVYRMTGAGLDHYELGWHAYARMYPTVNALRPDRTPFWPVEVDRRLARLTETCRTLRENVDDVREQAAEPVPERETPPGPDAPPELVRLTQLQHERVDAADRVRAVAAGQLPELEQLQDTAASRLLGVAAAVMAAVAAGQDPVAALDVADEPVRHLPEVPVGLPTVDKELADRRAALLGRPKRRRRTLSL